MNFKNYEKEGVSYDRITSILDYFTTPDLLKWKVSVGAKEAKRISSIAMKIGTEVDEVIKAEIEGKKASKLKSVEAKNCIEGYKNWVNDYRLSLQVPETVFNEELGVAGTPDLYCEDTVIDIKCSSAVRPQYWLQTEFYGRCLGMKYKAILRLDKNLALYSYKKTLLNDCHWEVVEGLIKAYRFYNEIKN